MDLILTDLKLPEMDGMQVLAHARQINSSAPVIVKTAFGTIENAVEATREPPSPQATCVSLGRLVKNDDRSPTAGAFQQNRKGSSNAFLMILDVVE